MHTAFEIQQVLSRYPMIIFDCLCPIKLKLCILNKCIFKNETTFMICFFIKNKSINKSIFHIKKYNKIQCQTKSFKITFLERS